MRTGITRNSFFRLNSLRRQQFLKILSGELFHEVLVFGDDRLGEVFFLLLKLKDLFFDCATRDHSVGKDLVLLAPSGAHGQLPAPRLPGSTTDRG